MKRWSDFYDLIMPDLPGCPSAAVDSALRQSAISFCEQSLVWREMHPDIPVVSGTAEYAFTPPPHAIIHAVIHATLGGQEMTLYAGEASSCIKEGHGRGRPEYICVGDTSLTLVPEPDTAGTLLLIVALKPSPVSTGIEDAQFNEYREAIVHGALMRLMLSPRKPYSSVQLAQYHQQQFTMKTAAAGQRVARGRTRAGLQTRIMARGIGPTGN